MSRRTLPFFVAGVTGILSGLYIFKPLLDQKSRNEMRASEPPNNGAPTSQTGHDTRPSASFAPKAIPTHTHAKIDSDRM
ncbi:hypothetical protein A0H81_11599 [Grifola frondosa]|uniref:Uncharacterized protein n=1 Tax=Grifola frondosa TaxID=5627 RepID=A0A1C7LUR9_GRIFR|nr:hypothetical protein A0H81_11599 [Grifola frondosa]